MRTRSASNGFTLVEMLVALFIFALIAVASAALLRSSTDSEQASREALADVSSLRRMNMIVERDIGQAIPRIPRDRSGVPESAFIGNDGRNGLLFAVVRRGWTNYDDAPRSSLQKVEYRLGGNRLERVAYPYVDGAAPSPPTLVMAGVENLRIRYLHEGEWRERWDPSDAGLMPAAVEVTFDQAKLGTIRQVFLVGDSA